MNKSYIFAALAAAALLPLTACHDDEPGQPTSGESQEFTISTKPVTANEVVGNDYENINNWKLIFVDNTGTIAAIVDRDPSKTNAVTEETFRTEIPAGTYTVYAFANTEDWFNDLYGISSLAVGGTLPTGFDSMEYGAGAGWTIGLKLPMTGKKNVTITNRVNEPFNIEVVRLYAKLQYEVTNKSTKSVTLNNIDISPMAMGPIPMFPDYSNLGDVPSTSLDGTTYTTVKLDHNQAITAEATKLYGYVREGFATSHPTNRYVIKVSIKRDGKAEELLYALTHELTYINRNDWINIPITITDYNLSIDVNFYPPIGGYPAVIKEVKNEEYYIKFGTEGRFTITPHMYDAAYDGEILTNNQISAKIKSISDPDGIFATNPAFDATTNEIIGDLNSNQGTAVVTLTFTIKQTDMVEFTYERMLFIIREN
ncbi:MAG: hypothetical protein ACI31D_01930 [Candidatus Limisoma sp.]